MGILTIQNLIFIRKLKRAVNIDLSRLNTASRNGKTEQVYSFRKINVSRFDLKEDPNTSKIQKNAYLLGHKLTFEQINKPYHALMHKRSFEPFMCLDPVLDR